MLYSTGAGQTGVFIAVSEQLDRVEKELDINIFDYVQYMRKQRPSMVTNEVSAGYFINHSNNFVLF